MDRIDEMRSQLDHGTYTERKSAIKKLIHMSHPQAVVLLIDVLGGDAEGEIRVLAARALKHFMNDDVYADAVLVAYLCALDDSDTDVWHAAAEGIWAWRADALPRVLNYTTDPDPRLRRLSLKAILWLTAESDDSDLLSMKQPAIKTALGWHN